MNAFSKDMGGFRELSADEIVMVSGGYDAQAVNQLDTEPDIFLLAESAESDAELSEAGVGDQETIIPDMDRKDVFQAELEFLLAPAGLAAESLAEIMADATYAVIDGLSPSNKAAAHQWVMANVAAFANYILQMSPGTENGMNPLDELRGLFGQGPSNPYDEVGYDADEDDGEDQDADDFFFDETSLDEEDEEDEEDPNVTVYEEWTEA